MPARSKLEEDTFLERREIVQMTAAVTQQPSLTPYIIPAPCKTCATLAQSCAYVSSVALPSLLARYPLPSSPGPACTLCHSTCISASIDAVPRPAHLPIPSTPPLLTLPSSLPLLPFLSHSHSSAPTDDDLAGPANQLAHLRPAHAPTPALSALQSVGPRDDGFSGGARPLASLLLLVAYIFFIFSGRADTGAARRPAKTFRMRGDSTWCVLRSHSKRLPIVALLLPLLLLLLPPRPPVARYPRTFLPRLSFSSLLDAPPPSRLPPPSALVVSAGLTPLLSSPTSALRTLQLSRTGQS
ncbi:hypothetical protein C8R44DRAFT_869021 [Mycena epipterygia]|nr:hypothetical protein C8R44DRAFT_869021 [Mycena epipterygia]